jgi:hypothetical protein
MSVTDLSDVRARFEINGYALIEDLFDPITDFEPVVQDWHRVIDELAKNLIASGALDSSYPGLPIAERLLAIWRQTGNTAGPHLEITLPMTEIHEGTPLNLHESIFNLITHRKLLDTLAELIGPEISSSPVQHIRTKMPILKEDSRPFAGDATPNYLAGKVGWHQDNGVLLEEADETSMISVWFPFTNATVENGCLRLIPGSHRSHIVDHCPSDGRGATIPDRLVPVHYAMPVPMRPGSALFFHERLMHESLDNVTETEVRISADLRYHVTGEPSGRPLYPSTIVRSAADPTSVADFRQWCRAWLETKARLVGAEIPKFYRWDSNSPACA